MDLRGWAGSLGRTRLVRLVVGCVAIWRQVYGAMGTDPTYQPQRDEDRLAEARRIVSAGDLIDERRRAPAKDSSKGREDP